MIQTVLEGLMLGLSSGIYCVGTCLIFFMPYLLVEGEERLFKNLKKVCSFMLGRMIAYIGFALIIGYIGMTYQNIFTAKFSHWSLIVASLLMLIYALTHNFENYKFCVPFIRRFSLLRIPFFLGLFSGLNPCPPFLVGATRLWTMGNIFKGVILFFAFFVGTSVYMVPLVFASYLNRIERIKRIALIVALLCSLWFLFVGITGVIK